MTSAVPDLHLLFASKATTKAKTFLSRAAGHHHQHSGPNALSSSLSKSPHNSSGGYGNLSAGVVNAEINRRDDRGRTVLHLACSETEPWAIEWIDALLAVPGCQINATDEESGWTALHRTLYVGNIAAATRLLARQDIDMRVKDHEGLTPFDLYNSTVEGTNPSDSPVYSLPARMDLYTWGANRNYVLGFAGDSDRSYPERVNLKRDRASGIEAHGAVRVKDVAMARLHSAIVTDESNNNVRLCGYGTGGRLGQSGHTMFTFTPLKDFPHTVSSVVLSPDHTVIVTASGGLWTFGTNRFSQLGYTIDTPSPAIPGGVPDEAVQMVPRKVLGALKKEVVLGAAASRTHTVAYTADSLFTWGTNKGQLGYSVAGSSVQLLPRKVTAVSQPVIMATATENATACLLESKDVVVLWHEGYVKLAFPMSRFPTRMQVYHPPQFSGKANITKITSCGATFAALSSHGDVFTFSFADGPAGGSDLSSSNLAKAAPTPQRIWSLRRKFTAVTDIAVGLDGTVILSTVSGHVFVRTRKFEASSKQQIGFSSALANSATPGALSSSGRSTGGGWKFSRVPYLQRVVKVAANSTGGFAAIRYDVPLRPVDIEGSSLAQDLSSVLPHWRRAGSLPIDIPSSQRHRNRTSSDESDDEAENDDAAIQKDVQIGLHLLSIASQWDSSDWETPLSGSDAFITTLNGQKIPVHSTILASRSPVLERALSESGAEATVNFDCSLFSALLVVQYLYTDSLPPVWDTRVGNEVRRQNPGALFDVAQTKSELQHLAKRFKLDALAHALNYHSKHVPTASLSKDVGSLLAPNSNVRQDVLLVLADRHVLAHSVVLRARCHFFETFFEETDWSSGRMMDDQAAEPLRFELDHIEWDTMRVVMNHIYTDAGVELFRDIDRDTPDEFIDYVLQVMAVANELLLDKLKSVCSAVLGSFVTLNNVCSVLSEAAFYEASDLARACMLYMACSMETLLEGHFIDDLSDDFLSELSSFVQERQSLRLPISRSGILVSDLMMKHSKWLSEQDVPKMTGGYRKWRPNTTTHQQHPSGRSPGPSPSALSPVESPSMRPIASPKTKSPFLLPTTAASMRSGAGQSEDEPFSMDDDFTLDGAVSGSRGGDARPTGGERRRSSVAPVAQPPFSSSPSTPSKLQPWSSSSLTSPDSSGKKAVDLKSIMASEQARTKSTAIRSPPSQSVRPTQARASSSSAWKPTGQTWQTVPVSTASPVLARPPGSNASSSNHQTPTKSSSSSRVATPSGLASTRPLDPNSALTAAVFTPSRQQPPSTSALGSQNRPQTTPVPSNAAASLATPGSNRSFSGADIPWTNYGPVSTGASASSSAGPNTPRSLTPVMAGLSSFASIQSEQQAQHDAIKSTKAPRSFASLMKADESAAKARAEEEAFARWWEEESKRVQGIAKEATDAMPGSKTASSRGGKKGGRGGGRARGSGSRGGKKQS